MVEHVIGVCHLALLVANDGEPQPAAGDLINVLDPATGPEKSAFVESSMAQLEGATYPPCDSMVFADRPISLTPLLVNSGSSFAKAPSSVVQTGV